MKYILAMIVFSMAEGAAAQDFVYKPLNPSFGGESFNSSHLLSMADRQNRFESDSSAISGRSTTEQFRRQIQSSLLSRVAGQISDRILGEDAQNSGEFKVDQTQISFRRIDGVVIIDIFDGLTGDTTQIEIPDPSF